MLLHGPSFTANSFRCFSRLRSLVSAGYQGYFTLFQELVILMVTAGVMVGMFGEGEEDLDRGADGLTPGHARKRP